MFDYKLLAALAAVVEQAGFERAAQALGLSQSAISQRIKLLEARVGQPVLLRDTPPRPTELGQRLLNHVQQVRLLARGRKLGQRVYTLATSRSVYELGERVGVCAVQYGPGCENAFGAMAQAYSDSSPVLMLPGGVNEARTDVRPNFETVKHYQNITKWVARVNRPDRVGEMLRRAYTGLRNGRRGEDRRRDQGRDHSRSVSTRATVSPIARATTTNTAVKPFWIAERVSPAMTPVIAR